jgi:hypothetical protein
VISTPNTKQRLQSFLGSHLKASSTFAYSVAELRLSVSPLSGMNKESQDIVDGLLRIIYGGAA